MCFCDGSFWGIKFDAVTGTGTSVATAVPVRCKKLIKNTSLRRCSFESNEWIKDRDRGR
jgi:hypothetical protein